MLTCNSLRDVPRQDILLLATETVLAKPIFIQYFFYLSMSKMLFPLHIKFLKIAKYPVIFKVIKSSDYYLSFSLTLSLSSHPHHCYYLF